VGARRILCEENRKIVKILNEFSPIPSKDEKRVLIQLALAKWNR